MNAFGEQVRWWRCPDCGWESDEAASDDFDALTERLTLRQRVTLGWHRKNEVDA